MAAPAGQDEDVGDFVKRLHVKSLESVADTGADDLEREILQSRKQREAIRAGQFVASHIGALPANKPVETERARSLSPDKQSSPVSTPTRTSFASPAALGRPVLSPSRNLNSRPPSVDADIVKSIETAPHAPLPSSPSTAPRSGHLSWQHRPPSMWSRPTSVLSPPPIMEAKNESDSSAEPVNRASIAKSLGQKDPNWFRQTEDRASGSVALRRNQDEAEHALSQASARHRLHGLGQGDAVPAPSSPGYGARAAPTPLSPSNRADTDSDAPQGHGLTMSPTPRFAVPASPTKGSGSFVQSAMMRRSESQARRFRAQSSSAGPSRPESVASFRLSRHGSQSDKGLESSTRASQVFEAPDPSGGESGTARQSRSPTKASVDKTDRTTSRSPEKKSPDKFSWVQTALGPKEPPPPSPRHTPSQPSWLTDLHKNKQAKLTQSDGSKNLSSQPSPADPGSSGRESRDEKLAESLAEPSGSPKARKPPSAQPKPSRLSGSEMTPAQKELPDAVQKKEQPPVAQEKEQPISAQQKEHSAPALAKEQPTTSKFAQPAHAKAASAASTVSTKASVEDVKPKPSLSRPASVQSGQGELEFQNAAGRLRRTQTQNYVAPDELKSNIMRGKTGLSATGGPQKSQLKDEFKESIVAKRISMKEKAGDPRSTPSRPTSIDEKPPTPEAIAKRKNMASSHMPKTSSSSFADNQPISSSPAATKPQPLGSTTVEKSSVSGPSVPEKPQRPSSSLRGLPQSLNTPPAVMPKASDANIAKGPAFPTDSKPSVAAATRPPVSDPHGGSAVSSAKGAIGGKLAGRFNPALAGMIARGPPAPSKEASSSSTSPLEEPRSLNATSSDGSSGQLDHMTKGRARGPKRRPPKANAPVERPETMEAATKALDASRPEEAAVEQAVQEQVKPAAPSKPSSFGMKSDAVRQAAAAKDKVASPSSSPAVPSKPTSVDSSPEKPASDAEMSKQEASRPMSFRPAAARLSQTPQSTRFPIKMPATKRESAIDSSKPTTSNATIDQNKPVSIQEQASMPASRVEAKDDLARDTRDMSNKEPKPAPATKASPQSLSASNAKVTPAHSKEASRDSTQETAQNQQLSPRSQTTDATQIIAGFFDSFPKAPATLDVDIAAILSAGSSSQVADFRTVDMELSIIEGDGQRTAVPFTQQQPVLYHDAMYLCKHVMKEKTAGQRVEVYLWKGRDVAEAEAYDAEVHAKKSAKDVGGTFIGINQGKEPANFFKALGDVVIFRQGRSPGKDRYMLCGRKHLGQFVAFDEVPFALGSFCSGFPFIVGDDRNHEVYLWKGNGCNPDELANAQMTSMSLSKSGKPIEMKEGDEPAAFVDLFPMPSGKKPVKAVPRSAEHWKRKSSQDKYATRLFHVSYGVKKDQADAYSGPSSPGAALWKMMGRRGSQQDANSGPAQRVKEIVPYSQRDLERNEIYVLDAFYEIYVIVGPDSHDQASSFATALLFAQDYSILAAGQQDRPFIPVGTVVMQGAPRDLKACFRGWDEERGLFAGSANTQTSTGKSLRIVPLSAAVVAVTKAL